MARPDISGKKVGPYLLTSIVGAGITADVYRAVDTSSIDTSPQGPEVLAIKRVRTKNLSHEQLMQIVMEVCHHNMVSGCDYVLPLRGLIEKKSFAYILFDLCESDVSRVIWKTDLYWRNEPLIKTAFLEILDGVSACHQRGITHRDLRPENLMCNANGTGIQIRGFGLASSERFCGEGGRRSYFYMSPECWLFEDEDPASDIWSLGVILFTMITGNHPWKVALSSDEDYLAYVRNPDYLCHTYQISQSLNDLLRRMLHPDPEKRFKIPRIRKEIITMHTLYQWDGDVDTPSVQKPVDPEMAEIDAYIAMERNQHTYAPSPFMKLFSWTKRHHSKSSGQS